MWVTQTGIEFIGRNDSFRTRYARVRPTGDVSDASNMSIRDVIITGEVCEISSRPIRLSDRARQTEAPYAMAWNGYRYIGRIRPLDGLVVLLRESVCDPFRCHTIGSPNLQLDPQRTDLGRALFRGYGGSW